MKKLLLSIMIAISLCLAIGCAATTQQGEPTTNVEDTTDVEDTTTQQGEPTTNVEEPITHRLGDTVDCNGISFCVTGIKEMPNTKYIIAEEGNKLVGIELCIRNNTNTNYTFSSVLLMDVLDAQGYPGSITLYTSSIEPVDGDVPPSTMRKGLNVFEVSDNVSSVLITPKLGTDPIVIQVD